MHHQLATFEPYIHHYIHFCRIKKKEITVEFILLNQLQCEIFTDHIQNFLPTFFDF